MIVNKDTRPEKKIYYLGALLIQVLKKYPAYSELDFFEVYADFNMEANTSVNLFVMTVDWLFLLGCVKSENNSIIKCF